MDWQAGDLALCVSAKHWPSAKGQIFTVSEVVNLPACEELCAKRSIMRGLRFVDWPDPLNGGAYDARQFVRITPPKDMIEETSTQSVEA